VSAARQAAVVVAIAELTDRHKLLKEPGRAMLQGLSHLASTEDENVSSAYRVACERLGIGN